jgi:hypothetical protein
MVSGVDGAVIGNRFVDFKAGGGMVCVLDLVRLVTVLLFVLVGGINDFRFTIVLLLFVTGVVVFLLTVCNNEVGLFFGAVGVVGVAGDEGALETIDFLR